MVKSEIIYREYIKESDLMDINELMKSSGFFYDYEIETAEDYFKDRFKNGEQCNINYFIAESDNKMIGFICFGFDSCTLYTHQLYWMAVHDNLRGKGIGKTLLQKFENYVLSKGGKKIVGETSGRELYKPTRDFYVRQGYTLAAEIPDYYSKGDSRITIVKDLG